MNLSIIGGGNLGCSIATGISKADPTVKVTISRRNISGIRHLEKIGIIVSNDNLKNLPKADLILICVKPHQLNDVATQIRHAVKGKIIVSTVTGKTIDEMESILGKGTCIFRAMPNTAIAIGESITCIAQRNASEKQIKTVETLFNVLGLTVFVEEKLMDASTVLGACGIAYAFRYIRAVMQGGIQIGFDSKTALRIAAQTVKGASSLLLENSTHPESEIDKVTTPQGCTIAGLNEMEHQGFSSSLIRGILESFRAIEKIKADSVRQG